MAWRNRLIFSALLLLLAVPAGAAVSPSGASVIVAPILPRDARWALVVVDLTTGTESLRAGNAPDQPMAPGSLMKLLLAGALLDHAAYSGKLEMRTLLGHDGAIHADKLDGNLYLIGRGNSLLSVIDLQGLVTAMTRRGLVKVVGDIVVDDALFDPRGLERKRIGAAHAPAGALGLDLHTVAIIVSPSESGKPPVVQVEPANNKVRHAVKARTVENVLENIDVKILDDTSYSIGGNIPIGAAPVRKRLSLHDPALYAGGALRTVLDSQGISVTGMVKRGKTPADAVPIAQIPSPDMEKLLRDMNVNSLNVVADNLFLLLGAEHFSPPGTREKGVRAVREFLVELGLPLDGVQIADGSGLNEENRVTAEFMAAYLRKVAQKPWFPQFYQTLPRAGMDGTVREIGFADERFRVKTGILPDAFGLAGYGVDGSGRKIAFAFLVNHPGISGFDTKRAGAEVMKLLAKEVSQ